MFSKTKRMDELHMDRDIACAKASACLRRYKRTHDANWLDLSERHLLKASGLLLEIDRHSHGITDMLDYVGALRCD